MRFLKWATSALAATTLLACKKSPDPPLRHEPHASAAAPSAVPDAGAPKKLVDLLRAVPASVVVSSTVDNPRDYPGHLIDGRADTAWNSKTGDLVGAFIEVTLAEDATIDHFAITAGFDKVNKDGDLFTLNPRISEVKVTHAGEDFGTFPLDVNVRTPQTIPVGRGGGTWKITVSKIVLGTKAAWKEIVVSEFSVVGTPGKTLRKDEPILVLAADTPAPTGELCLDPLTCSVRADAPLNAFPTFDALCKEISKRSAAAWQTNRHIDRYDDPVPGDPKSAKVDTSCTFEAAKFPAPAPFDRIGLVKWTDGRSFFANVVVGTADGVRIFKRPTPDSAWDFDEGKSRMEQDALHLLKGVVERSAKLENGALVIEGEATLEYAYEPPSTDSNGVNQKRFQEPYTIRVPVPAAGKAP